MGDTHDHDPFGAPDLGTPDERRESQVLLEALTQRKAELSAAAHLPVDDKALSERILGEARRRSEQISASSNAAASSRRLAEHERMPWWLIALWVAALVATVAAFKFLL